MQCAINDFSIQFELDTGSFGSTINADALNKIPNVVVENTNVKAKGYSNTAVEFLGETVLSFKYKKRTILHKFLVVPKNYVSLIGRDLCAKLNLKIEIPGKNIHSLKNISEKFKTYFDESFVSCVQHTVSLPVRSDAKPVYCRSRPVPLRYKDKLRAELDRLQKLNIITPRTSSAWCSPIVCCLKANNSIRLTGDYSMSLNKYLEITRFPLPTIEDVSVKMGKNKYFSKIDMVSAFLQLPLDEKSKEYTTIATPFGNYSFNYLPLGTSASPAIFQKFLCTVLAEFEDSVVVYQDDILLGSETEHDHSILLDKVLSTLQSAGLKINQEKCKFFTDKVEYLGYIFSSDGIHADNEKVRAILEAPVPQNVKQTQSLIGLCNYYNRFIKNFSEVFAPLNKLLRKNEKFVWGEDQQKCFDLIKKLFTTDVVLRNFQVDLPTAIECDGSSVGVGVCLMQKYSDGWYPVQYGSRTLNQAERRYSQIEREALSIVYGCEKFRKFLLGGKFTVFNDHSPLKKLFGSTSRIPDNCSARLTRWALRLSQFNFDVQYIKGVDAKNSDFGSRLPLQDTVDLDEPYEIIFAVECLNKLPITCNDVMVHTNNDKNLAKLKKYILEGFPDQLDKELSAYKNYYDELSIVSGCLMYKNRVFIPSDMREDVLQQFHANHPGLSAMKVLVRQCVWWPGLDTDVEKTCRSCSICQESQIKPPHNNYVAWPKIEKPFYRIHIDHFFFEDKIFFVVVDAFSRYIEAFIVKSTSSACTVDALREVFCRQGLPSVLVSDNHASFLSYDFKDFLSKNGIKHLTSPVMHAPSNGQAEKSVGVLKNLLKKNKIGSLHTRLCNVLMYYRSTPHSVTKVAPCVLLNNRKIVTIQDKINPIFGDNSVREGRQLESLKSFEIGSNVLAMNFRQGPKWYAGIITSRLGANIYEVFISDLKISWRRHSHQLLSSVPVGNSSENSHTNDIDNDHDIVPLLTSNASVPVNQNPHAAPCSTNTGSTVNAGSACSRAQSQIVSPASSPVRSSSSSDESYRSCNSPNSDDADRLLPRRSKRKPKPVVRLNL